MKDGYMYVFQKTLANDVKCYECVLRRKGECKAKIKLTPEDNFLNQLNEHTHLPSQTKIEVEKVKARVKERAENTNDTSHQILGAELQNMNESTTVNLPALNNMRRNIRRQRGQNNMPPIPQRREEIPPLPHRGQIAIPTARYSDSSIFRQNQKNGDARYSDSSISRQSRICNLSSIF